GAAQISFFVWRMRAVQGLAQQMRKFRRVFFNILRLAKSFSDGVGDRFGGSRVRTPLNLFLDYYLKLSAQSDVHSQRLRQAALSGNFIVAAVPSLALLLFLRPGIFQSDGAIENQLARLALRIQREIGQPLELVAQFRFRIL